MRKALGTVMAVGALAVGGLFATAGSAAAGPCGFYLINEGLADAWYNHCGSGNVVIVVEVLDGLHTYERCVPPGETLLETNGSVDYAYYVRPC